MRVLVLLFFLIRAKKQPFHLGCFLLAIIVNDWSFGTFTSGHHFRQVEKMIVFPTHLLRTNVAQYFHFSKRQKNGKWEVVGAII